MKHFSKLMLIALSIGISAVALSLVPSKPAGAAGSAPVMVTNTPLPVTLQGTGNISGNVSAAQTGAWNVGINNAGTSPVPVRDMDNAARRVPFQTSLFALLPNGGATADGTLDLSAALPSGKGFVIEHLSAQVVMPTGQKALLFVGANKAGGFSVGFNHGFLLEPQGTINGLEDFLVASTPLHAFVDSSMSLAASLTRLASSNSGEGSVDVFVSGYLVDCGAGSGCPIP